jgi:hypothetical protein
MKFNSEHLTRFLGEGPRNSRAFLPECKAVKKCNKTYIKLIAIRTAMWNALREIDQKETAICGPHNVSWLEVAMKNACKARKTTAAA